MTHLRLRTQLFVATLLTICGLTGGLLLIIRHTVSVETERQVRDGTEESVRAFESVQRQWERQLSSMAAMLANLPTLEALMTTEHALTIQDGSTTYWKLAGSDLFVLAKPDRQIVALHMTNPGWPTEAAQRLRCPLHRPKFLQIEWRDLTPWKALLISLSENNA